jgi:hypothetical protein
LTRNEIARVSAALSARHRTEADESIEKPDRAEIRILRQCPMFAAAFQLNSWENSEKLVFLQTFFNMYVNSHKWFVRFLTDGVRRESAARDPRQSWDTDKIAAQRCRPSPGNDEPKTVELTNPGSMNFGPSRFSAASGK